MREKKILNKNILSFFMFLSSFFQLSFVSFFLCFSAFGYKQALSDFYKHIYLPLYIEV